MSEGEGVPAQVAYLARQQMLGIAMALGQAAKASGSGIDTVVTALEALADAAELDGDETPAIAAGYAKGLRGYAEVYRSGKGQTPPFTVIDGGRPD